MAGDHEQALAKPRAGPGRRGRLNGSASNGYVREDSVASRRPHGTAALSLVLPVADAAGLTAAALVSGAGHGTGDSLLGVLYIAVVLVILAAGGQHRLRICRRVSDQAGRIVIATAVPVPGLLPWLPAARVLWLALWSGALVLAGRGLLCAALRRAHGRGLLTEPAVIVGAGTFGAYIAELIGEHPELGLRLVGLLDDGPPRRDLPVPSLGGPADLAGVVRGLGIRRVIVCFSSACRDEDLVTVIRASRPLRADVCVVPRLYELGMAVPRGCLDEIWGIPLVPLRSFGHSATALRLKRVFDLVVSATLLAVTAPLMLALGTAVRLRTGQEALFRQARVIGQGRVVPVIKLRTLTAHDDHDTRWTAAEPSPLGRWLRATHMDELPQLVNVMRGQMSLVGPRPERPYFSERFSRDIPRYADRTRMPAGLTGWAQVNGLNGDTSIFERARFDNYYAEYWSVWLDLVILARTVAAVVRGTRPVRRAGDMS
jgi:exopolysaccharide biosynthesis polyprenyl glycosylphosphotransferase